MKRTLSALLVALLLFAVPMAMAEDILFNNSERGYSLIYPGQENVVAGTGDAADEFYLADESGNRMDAKMTIRKEEAGEKTLEEAMNAMGDTLEADGYAVEAIDANAFPEYQGMALRGVRDADTRECYILDTEAGRYVIECTYNAETNPYVHIITSFRSPAMNAEDWTEFEGQGNG